jgi:competence protein ComEA
MRNPYFSSLIFALLAGVAATVVNAAPVAKSQVEAPIVASAPAPVAVTKLDLNTADAAALQRELFGVGETKAKAIVAYRESNGPFTSVDELLEVKGIGKVLLEKNREKLEVN